MKRILSLRAALLLSLFLGFFAPRAEAVPKILNFQLGAIGVFPPAGGEQFFGQLAWTPYFGAGTIGIRGDFGVTFLKDGMGSRFLAVNTEALLSLGMLPGFSLELGGGLHNWVNNGGSAGALSANATFSTVGLFDRIYVGFSRFFLGNGVNEFRAGIGVDL